MGEITMTDVVAASYAISQEGLQYLPAPTKKNTALLLVDIQGMTTPEFLAAKAVAKGLPKGQVDAALLDYRSRFKPALEACGRLLAGARANSIPPIHVKIECLSADGRDTGFAHKLINWIQPPGSEGSRFLDECRPNPGEIVMTKTVSGAFSGTVLDRVLNHMGVRVLYIAGFMTDECVDLTARTALDLGYFTTLVSDATTTYFEDNYRHVVDKFTGWGLAAPAQQVIQTFEALPKG